jgi:transposase-like protein
LPNLLGGEPVTEHDVLVGFRLRLFTLAEELGNVSAACRAMGVDRSTYYRWKDRLDRWGLEALRVKGAPAPADAQLDRAAS